MIEDAVSMPVQSPGRAINGRAKVNENDRSSIQNLKAIDLHVELHASCVRCSFDDMVFSCLCSSLNDVQP